MKYTILDYPSSGLVLTSHPEFGRQLWSSVKLRSHKSSLCVICNKPLNNIAYRPVTNLRNRGHRICLNHYNKS